MAKEKEIYVKDANRWVRITLTILAFGVPFYSLALNPSWMIARPLLFLAWVVLMLIFILIIRVFIPIKCSVCKKNMALFKRESIGKGFFGWNDYYKCSNGYICRIWQSNG
jgi:branched-subunit amino acid permease